MDCDKQIESEYETEQMIKQKMLVHLVQKA